MFIERYIAINNFVIHFQIFLNSPLFKRFKIKDKQSGFVIIHFKIKKPSREVTLNILNSIDMFQ